MEDWKSLFEVKFGDITSWYQENNYETLYKELLLFTEDNDNIPDNITAIKYIIKSKMLKCETAEEKDILDCLIIDMVNDDKDDIILDVINNYELSYSVVIQILEQIIENVINDDELNDTIRNILTIILNKRHHDEKRYRLINKNELLELIELVIIDHSWSNVTFMKFVESVIRKKDSDFDIFTWIRDIKEENE